MNWTSVFHIFFLATSQWLSMSRARTIIRLELTNWERSNDDCSQPACCRRELLLLNLHFFAFPNSPVALGLTEFMPLQFVEGRSETGPPLRVHC